MPLRIDPLPMPHRITGSHFSIDGAIRMSGKEQSAMSGEKKVSEMSFEQALAGLSELVEKLESGELPLEESVAAFEQGVTLSRRCEALLDQADQRLQVLDNTATERDE